MPLRFGLPIGSLGLQDRVGTGASGHVFRSVHPETGQPLAVKIFPFDASDPAIRPQERFWRECKVLSSVNHPCFPSLYGCGEEDDNMGYAIMEWVGGRPLDAFRDAPVPAVLRMACQLLQGLRCLHRAGFVHRDLAFDNILVEERRSGLYPRLIDFAAAKDLNIDLDVTLPGSFLGRPGFAPPEVFSPRGSAAIDDPRSDVFAFGVLMFEWLTGIPPFPGKTPGDVMRHHRKGSLPKFVVPESRGPSDPHLESLVLSLLERDIAKRLDTTSALKGMLAVAALYPGEKVPPLSSQPEDLVEESVKGSWHLRGASFPALLLSDRLLRVDPERGAEVERGEEGTIGGGEGTAGDSSLPADLDDAPPVAVQNVMGEIQKSPWAANLILIISIMSFLAACLFAWLFVFRR